MKKEQFEFNELPYPTLARFGLTQEMIEDLPLCIPVSYTHLAESYNGQS